MFRRGIVSAFFFVLACIICLSPVSAAWQENGTPYCPNSMGITGRAAAGDGFGGILVLGEHTGWTGGHYLLLQRIDGYGNSLWSPPCGAFIDTLGEVEHFALIPDGSGGAIVAAVRAGDLFVYRVDAQGAKTWGSNGISICTAGDTLASPCLVSDGGGGCYIAWQDFRDDGGDIYAQRISASGFVHWTANGIAVCDTTQAQYAPCMARDGEGGVIIAWTDARDSLETDIYAASLSGLSGSALWQRQGVPVCNAAGDQELPVASPYGTFGGAVIAWIDERSGDANIYAQRLLQTGAGAWTADGIPVCSAAGGQSDLTMVPDGSSGAFLLAWVDRRGSSADIYAQKLGSTGSVAWLANGAPVCGQTGDQLKPGIVPDGTGGAIISWQDGRTDPEPDIYVQRMNASGFAAWAVNGLALCALPGAQADPAIASDGAGGALVSWTSPRPDGYPGSAGYCQRIERNGYWGYPAPRIAAVRDVPGDQGGFVNLAWDASRLDPWPYQTILNYSVWRAIRTEDAMALMADGARAVPSAASLDPESEVPQLRIELIGATIYYWKFISYLYAASLDHYAEIVPTVFDSTAVCDEYHYFQVIAHSSVDPKAAWISAPDSGYSVDNLAPAAPCSLVAYQVGNDVRLSWRANREADFSHYALFRGATEDFEPIDPVCVLTDTAVVDTAWAPGANDYYYKLIAYDIHGNPSPAALLRPDAVVATLLQFCAARVVERGIMIEWRLSEMDEDARFRMSRRERAEAAFAPIDAAPLSREGLSFVFIDEDARPGQEYRYRVEVSSGSEWTVLFETDAVVVPNRPLSLFQNHPNPFNPSTAIRFFLPAPGRVTLDIYDVAGRRIRALVDERRPAGHHTVLWDGADDGGRPASSGVYFYVLRADKEQLTRKMTLLR